MYRKFLPKNLINRTIVNYRRFNEDDFAPKEKITPDQVLDELLGNNVTKNEDWQKVRQRLFAACNFVTPVTIDPIIMGFFCTRPEKYELGKKYLEFLKEEKIKPNLATIGRYLRLLYEKNCEQVNEVEAKEILDLYNELRKVYPILDPITLEYCIMGLSVTPEWRKCVDLLSEVKFTASPSTNCYSALIGAAFLNHEEDLGWKFLNEMIEGGKTPKTIIYTSYLNSIKTLDSKKKIHAKIDTLFEFLKHHDLRLERDFIENLEAMESTLSIETKVTSVTRVGKCRHCDNSLQKFELTDEEFTDLKNNFFENVIVGKDLFVKTNPDELAKFKRFIAKQEKFDVVLDGLNVAYMDGTYNSAEILSKNIAYVVKHFVDQRKKVLVLGRLHMNHWPTNAWDYVREKATIFLTQNISEDDPYLLYCAMNSGKNTIIVTRDLMRGHKFLLKSNRLKVLFNRWLTQRQYQLSHVDQRKTPVFKEPLVFSTNAQKNGGCWHLPFDAYDNPKKEYHNSWDCVRFK